MTTIEIETSALERMKFEAELAQLRMMNKWLREANKELSDTLKRERGAEANKETLKRERAAAGAPELLEVLQAVAAHYREPHCIEALAPVIKAAIAKATRGEP